MILTNVSQKHHNNKKLLENVDTAKMNNKSCHYVVLILWQTVNQPFESRYRFLIEIVGEDFFFF